MTIMRSIVAAAVLATGMTVSVPAAADITTFANYTSVGGANIYWKQSASKTGGSFFTIASPIATTPGSVPALFTFLSPSVIPIGCRSSPTSDS